MRGAYFDVSYLAKLHWREVGTHEVLALAGTFPSIVCGQHGQAEFLAVGHRKVREKAGDLQQARNIFKQLQHDTASGGVVWLPLSSQVFCRVEAVFLSDPGSVFLRASDALHLACAAEHGFKTVYSNDRHFLTAAPLFGLKGINIITSD